MHRESARWLRAAAAALAAAALLPPADASDPGAAWAADERTVTAWPDGGGFALRSARDSALGSDEIVADYDARSAHLRVGLQAQQPEQNTLELDLGLVAVTEFRDADGDGRLGPGEAVLRRVAIPGTPAVAAVEAVSGGGWRATSTHALPAEPGGAPLGAAPRLEVTVEARPAPAGGKEPTSLDLAVRLVDGWARNGTHIALETTLDGSAPPDTVTADAARLRDRGLSLDALWQDGRGTVVEGSDPRSVSFVRSQPAGHVVAFPAAVAASWRPAEAPRHAPGGNALLYAGAAAAAATAIAVPTWRRLRS